MKQYKDLLQNILDSGEIREDRTGVGTLSVFGGHIKFDLRERFPLVTIKKTLWKHAFVEMLWFLRGEPNIKFLHEHNCKIWDEWADKDGNLGPVYGVQWRRWKGPMTTTKNIHDIKPGQPFHTFNQGNSFAYEPEIDQIKNLINTIKVSPKGRRHIVTAWNPGFIDVMGLPPCHRDFQCYVSNDGHLDLMMSQRSWDTVLGAPFNIAQYALLTHLLAQCTGLTPRYLMINYGDAHIYLNHVDGIKEVLKNDPIDCPTKLIINNSTTDIDSFKIEDFSIEGYESGPFVKFEVAV
jgi:thymidylate synthase